ncbi:MAG: DUF2027 domain-containing protein [Tannerella sp.]|jgi:hypothetical protein|nr:DUF2027 domain-containing protein [Tannerella sp.]
MVQIGDKVRFLNSTGGGIVKSFQGKDKVLVEDESGFDFPAFTSECVVVSKADDSFRVPSSPKAKQPVAAPPVSRPEPAAAKPVPVVETSGGERLNVFLAFLPVDTKAPTQGNYEAYFINESNYFLYFNYMNCTNNSWESRYNGMIEPHTKIFIEEFGKEDLNGLERVCVQLIAFKKDKPFALKNACSVELRIDTVKFYKVHCFRENDFFNEEALIYPVMVNDVPEKQMLVSAVELQEAMLRKKGEDRHPVKPPVSKPNETAKPVLEIDLHINQLLDNTSGMSNSEMLNYQLDKFHETMKANLGKKGQQIVFIHGKGEGVLRTAIEKELKTRYKSSCSFQDASFREYGYGATLVKIR